MKGRIRIKRVYEPVSHDDGKRILVDRVWPRGQRKDDVACESWAKAITPSTGLRKAFHAGTLSGEEFSRAYHEELSDNPEFPAFVEAVREALNTGNITLITAARLAPHNHCEVLRSMITAALEA